MLFVDDDETAEAAQEAGLLAVSPPPGWRRGDVRRQLEVLQGRDVLLAPTADDVGLEDAAAIGAVLGGIAQRVRIASVPGAERPGALAGLFRSGLSLREIEAAVGDAEGWRTPRHGGEVEGLVRASEIVPRRQRWLWEGFVPLGGWTMLDGDPGKGKSSISWDLAARVTRGWAMPDGSRGLGKAADVVVIASEDSIPTTTLPRLLSAGADPARIHFLKPRRLADGTEEPLEIPRDAWRIEDAVRATGAVLVVFESLMEVLGDETNAHSDHRVRRALAAVREMAQLEVAVLAVRHLNKGQGKALYRGMGSIGFNALARSVLLAGDDPSDPTGERRVLAVVKSNLAKRPGSLAYHIEGAEVPDPAGGVIETQRTVWDGTCELRADDILGAVAATPQKSEMERAVEFLSEQLARGAVASVELLELGEEEGITEGTLRRAAKRLGVDFRRVGFGAGSRVMWDLRDRPEAHTLHASLSV